MFIGVRAGPSVTDMRLTNSKPQPSNQCTMEKSSPAFLLKKQFHSKLRHKMERISTCKSYNASMNVLFTTFLYSVVSVINENGTFQHFTHVQQKSSIPLYQFSKNILYSTFRWLSIEVWIVSLIQKFFSLRVLHDFTTHFMTSSFLLPPITSLFVSPHL